MRTLKKLASTKPPLAFPDPGQRFRLLFSWLFVLVCAPDQSIHAQDTDPCFQLTLSSQAEVDAFDCEEVRNGLFISGEDIVDLRPLRKLKTFTGNLIIRDNAQLKNLEGLENIRSLFYVEVNDNPQLESLEGLQGYIFSAQLDISNNPKLSDLKGLRGLIRIGTRFDLRNNPLLESLDGLDNLLEVNYLSIWDNHKLESLSGMNRIQKIQGFILRGNKVLTNLEGLQGNKLDSLFAIEIMDNEQLRSLKGLEPVRFGERVKIQNNPQLSDFSAFSSNLKRVQELTIENTAIQDFMGFSKLEAAGSFFFIEGNTALTSLRGLEQLSTIGDINPSTFLGSLVIRDNPSLNDIASLSQLSFMRNGMSLENNPQLGDCCVMLHLRTLAGGPVIVSGNGLSCSSLGSIQINCGPKVDRFVLVNAVTGDDIQVLQEGDVISYSGTPLSIRVEDTSGDVQSVTLRLTGPKKHFQIESVSPFSLFGDKGFENYEGEILPPGNYTIFALAYPEKRRQGNSGEEINLKFSIAADNPQITRLELFEPDERTGTFRTLLNDGDRINIEDLTDGFPFFTIQALTDPGQIGSVHFSLQGPINIEQTENRIPYVIFGDIKNMDFNSNRDFDFNSQQLLPGAYTLRVTPYSLPNRQGVAGETQVIRFEAFVPESGLLVSPNPSEGPIQIKTSQAGLLQLYNPRGEQIYQQEFDQAFDIDLDLENREGGLYLIRYIREGKMEEKKIMLK